MTDIFEIAKTFGINTKFPKKAKKDARELNDTVRENEIFGREDFRGLNVFTIDGDDTKDIDDALSIVMLDKNTYEIGVHIADVSHYVTAQSPLDLEALNRGTSVYLIDKVIPMLPKALSNGICSLNPGEDRLTLSCVMKLNDKGEVLSYRIVEGAIRSRYQLTYNKVNMLLRGDKRIFNEYSDIASDLFLLNSLAKNLRKNREETGSLDFELDEAKILVDEKGNVCDVIIAPRDDAEKLIEEFMLLANRTVATHYFNRKIPFVYRVHPRPEPEKQKRLSEFLSGFGYTNIYTAKDMQNVLNDVEGKPYETIVHKAVLRSMAKAVYSHICSAHFGLGFECYTHFTSPIRRYPDLQVHRIIKQTFNKKLRKSIAKKLPEVCDMSSFAERNAIECERKVNDIYKAEYMKRHVGDEFDAVISGVSNGALFAELYNTCEGVIPLSSITDDYYAYFEEHYCVIGERTRKKYSLGDKVRVRVISAQSENARVVFEILDSLQNSFTRNSSKIQK